VGLLTLRPVADALVLDHLYVEPKAQGQGLGAWALDWVKAQADSRQLPVSLSALRESAANRFYQRHGFVEVGRSEFDIDYRRMPAAHREAAPAWRTPERYAGISVQALWPPV
jgi:ribosomal protein S18 acetylase RimI-like enzyme